MSTTQIISRKEAKAAGLVRYFTGKPCKNGHMAERRSSDGHCSVCNTLSHKAHKLKNPEKERARQRDRSKRNRAHKTLLMAAWRARNPGRDRETALIRISKDQDKEKARRIRDYQRRLDDPEREKLYRITWKINNPDKAKAKYQRDLDAVRKNPDRRRLHAAKYYAANKAKEAARNRIYRNNNPDKTRAHCRNRQARKKLAEGRHTAEEIQFLFKKQKGRCGYFRFCGRHLKDGYDVDHIKPIVAGGSNRISNLQLLCPSCNRSKGAKDAILFARNIGLLI